MEVADFEDIQAAMIERIRQAVYCIVATCDRKHRPRSRVMHLIWDGPTGWCISWPQSHKTRHLAHNPAVSITYLHDPTQPVYIDCTAVWVEDTAEKQRIWDLHRAIPPPLGFDPEPHYGSINHPYYGLLRFIPWRIELADLHGTSLVWRPTDSID